MKINDFVNSLICALQQVKHFKRNSRVVYNGTDKGVINILGNGPSLSSSIATLANRVGRQSFFAVNDFAVSDAFTILQPDNYVLIDPAYFSDNTNAADIEMRNRVFSRMHEKVSWKMQLYVPYKVYRNKVFKETISNNNIEICPFNYIGFHPTKTKFYSYILKKNLGTVPVGNVLGAAIHIALNKGYQEIHIYGADHTWTKDLCVNEQNQVCTIKRHFFNDKATEELVPWHASDTHIFKMHEILMCLYKHFYGYEFLEWYASNLGCKILNCTPGTFIDAFRRGNC